MKTNQSKQFVDQQKHYTVTWEGTEPYRCNRQDAMVSLWVAHFTGSKASVYSPKDPGFLKSWDMIRGMFSHADKSIQERVLEELCGFALEKMRGMLAQIGIDSEVVPAEKDIAQHLSAGLVECWISCKFALNHPLLTYTIGTACGDWHEQLVTINKSKACVKVATLAFEQKAEEQVKEMLAA